MAQTQHSNRKEKMKTIKVLDLFSGIGGFAYALDNIKNEGEQLFETVAFCEIDKDAQKVLKKNFPHVPIFENVTSLTVEGLRKAAIADIDLICGGFP